MTNHPIDENGNRMFRRRFERVQFWSLIIGMISVCWAVTSGTIFVVNKHAGWMKKIEDLVALKKEIDTTWHPKIIALESTTRSMNTKLDDLQNDVDDLKRGQAQIYNLMLKRRSL